MAPIPLTNANIWVGGHDFTGDSNKLMLAAESEALDATTFASGGFKEFAGGLKQVTAGLEGFWSSATSDSVDSDTFPALGTPGEVVTASPAGTALDPAYMVQVARLKYEIGGEVGKLAPFKLDMSGSNTVGMVRGQVAKGRGSVAGVGVLGSGVQLGTVAAGRYLYGSLHILGTPGTTITVVVESATDAVFTVPTTRATIGPLTTAGGTWATRVAGPLTDTYYRYRVSAITGTFLVAGALGIGT